VKLNDKGFLSRDITVRELIEYKSDVHHVFPRDLLKKANMTRGQYNQIANFVIAQSEINIQISNKEPTVYFNQIIEQTNGGKHFLLMPSFLMRASSLTPAKILGND
jgi:hypothetical protein